MQDDRPLADEFVHRDDGMASIGFNTFGGLMTMPYRRRERRAGFSLSF